MGPGGPGAVSQKTTAPDRGSFPLDHDRECSHIMIDYLKCMKLAQGRNAAGCRLLAKEYLRCRMENNLMTQDSWDNLGLPDDDETTVTYSAALSKMAANKDSPERPPTESKPADSKSGAGSGPSSTA
ncbi:YALI0E34540p [Yarrowia lipolytica CLIB122]|uniref:YALI0E34540p n=2 Tax=Yarrowia lipolytica TaxID=4952 RepID=B5FVG7_YARLI|nr:YALI0E34540p [Yarrowia lipolytica CLIB122]CAR64352.1 YALI0E34540p [Yarrowia lipolytica CLIB122]SEI31725.1 YALIA101S02e00738g1_1 [Yarrowia lipolytica]VBB77409.1 Protein required for cytochrome c oxidase assembly, putative [Yarrowia lipolytica]|eukprot:XP_002143099.1 YALI0E34540p [Yarrowia lipolytica CLIB122]